MNHEFSNAGLVTSDLCSLTSSAQAGSSTVREHSADIRETVVRLHLGLLATIRREKSQPLRLRCERMNRREFVAVQTDCGEPRDGPRATTEHRMLPQRHKRNKRPASEVVV